MVWVCSLQPDYVISYVEPQNRQEEACDGRMQLGGTSTHDFRLIIDLIDGLNQLGVDVTCSDTGCPPVVINAKGIEGGSASISGQISSQFLSALLMTAPLAKGPIELNIKDELMSAPYVHMTMQYPKNGNVIDQENT